MRGASIRRVRLFTAVYPSAGASAHLDLALGGVGGPALADPGAGLRWVPAEQRHVTLAFHGQVPDGAVPGYVDALVPALAGLEAFDVALAGGGSFGGRTLWVGVTGALDALRTLSAVVEETAGQAGLPAADRAGGRPHLTVARASAARAGRAGRSGRPGERGSRRPRRVPDDAGGTPLAHWARALAVYRGPAWRVRTVRVVASELGAGRSGGPSHHEVAAISLAG